MEYSKFERKHQAELRLFWGAQAIGACLQLMIRTLTATSQRLICRVEHLCRCESMAEMMSSLW